MKKDIIISLFDYSGNWSSPYRYDRLDRYKVIQIDLKHGVDILTWEYKWIPKDRVLGILAAVPCTDFALSGARHFKAKDADGRTAKSIKLAYKTLEIIDYFNPDFYAIENPMSRIHKLVPELGKVKFKFDPYEFAQYDPGTRN
jgi:site-specific DNA-cytosine methylase